METPPPDDTAVLNDRSILSQKEDINSRLEGLQTIPDITQEYLEVLKRYHLLDIDGSIQSVQTGIKYWIQLCKGQ